MYKTLLKYICIIISLILFVNYLPAQVNEKSPVDSTANTQTSIIEIDTTEQSDATEKIEVLNDGTGKIDTVGQKISDKEKEELRKEKKKALIGFAIIGTIILFWGFIAYMASELGHLK